MRFRDSQCKEKIAGFLTRRSTQVDDCIDAGAITELTLKNEYFTNAVDSFLRNLCLSAYSTREDALLAPYRILDFEMLLSE